MYTSYKKSSVRRVDDNTLLGLLRVSYKICFSNYNNLPKGQSSPGILQSGQLASKGIRQMPQLSSLAIHRQVATPVQPIGKFCILQIALIYDIRILVATSNYQSFIMSLRIIFTITRI